MNSVLEDIKYLSQDIGPRPAGTEEEHKASMYIGERISKTSGLKHDIEEFEGARGSSRSNNICAIICSVLLILSAFLNIIQIPALIICLILSICMSCEFINKPILSNFTRRGLSQNVVAKYIPNTSSEKTIRPRKRKLIFLSHYDSGHAMGVDNSNFYSFYKLSKYLSFISCWATTFFLLLNVVFFGETQMPIPFFICVALILVVLNLLPSILGFYISKSNYNQGANCNASGSAVLIELAKILGTGSFGVGKNSTNSSVIHGLDQVKKMNNIPDDLKITYDDSTLVKDPNQGFLGDTQKYDDALEQKEKRLEEAKKAAKTYIQGKEKETKDNIDKQQNLQNTSHSQESKSIEQNTNNNQNNELKTNKFEYVPNYQTKHEEFDNTPEWFKTAQNKSKNKNNESTPDLDSVRSKFAYTMDSMQEKQDKKIEEEEEKKRIEREKLKKQIEEANLLAEQKAMNAIGVKKEFFREKNKNDVNANNDLEKTNSLEVKKSEKPDESQESIETIETADNISVDIKEDNNEKENKPTVVVEDNDKNINLDIKINVENNNEQEPNHAQFQDIDNKDTKIKNNTGVDVFGNTDKDKDNFINNTPTAKFDVPIDDIQDEDKNLNTESEEIKEEDIINKENKIPRERSEHLEAHDLEATKQFAPLDDQNFVKTPNPEEPKSDADINNDSLKGFETSSSVVGDVDKINDRGMFGTGSFAFVKANSGMAGATGTFAAVKQELIDNQDKESMDNLVVEDADDKAYSDNEFTSTGAFTGSDYIDMPKSKSSVFSIFNKKAKSSPKHSSKAPNKEDKSKNGSDSDKEQEQFDKFFDNNWEGGAFSSIKNNVSRITSKVQKNIHKSSEEIDGYDLNQQVEGIDNVDMQNQELDNNQYNLDYNQDSNLNKSWPVTSENARVERLVSNIPDFDKQIQEFQDGSVNIEVWFVGLGSEIEENSGIRNFLTQHSDELKGAILVDIEGLGAGELTLIEGEGLIKKTNTNSRFKRYVRKAANRIGMSVPSMNISFGQSSAAYANRLGYNTIRLAGIENSKVAYSFQQNDTIEIIDKDKLQQNIAYLMSLIQSV